MKKTRRNATWNIKRRTKRQKNELKQRWVFASFKGDSIKERMIEKEMETLRKGKEDKK